MIYTEATRRAMKIMYRQHQGQVDKSGVPYVFHPWHVAEQMSDEDEVICALLHDVAEDTDMTLDEIRQEGGFSDTVMEALRLLTHEKGISYNDYIHRLALNPIARHVKIADLTHNMDYSRLKVVTQEDRERHKKYQRSINYLKSIDDMDPEYWYAAEI